MIDQKELHTPEAESKSKVVPNEEVTKDGESAKKLSEVMINENDKERREGSMLRESEKVDKERNKTTVRSIETKEEEINEWKKITGEGRSSTPHYLQYGQVTIATPSRYAALRNTNEKGDELEKESLEDVEETRSEEVDDIYQSIVEESIEENKKRRARQVLPRQSKTNHRVVNPDTLNPAKDKRGSRKNH